MNCFCCKNHIEAEEACYIMGVDVYCCHNCANLFFNFCTDCHRYFSQDYVYKHVCKDCLKNNYYKCCKCNRYTIHESCNYDSEGKVYCNTCFNNWVKKCEDCGNLVNKFEMVGTIYHTINGHNKRICLHCFNSYYQLCNDCSLAVRIEDLICYESENKKLCKHCRLIHRYNWEPNVIFHSEKNENRDKTLHVGIELEIQGEGKDNFAKELAEFYNNENYFYLKNDGSLDNTGVEIVSHPMSYKYIINNNHWKNIFDLMNKYNMNDTENCGLHFHLDKQYLNEKAISNIDNIINCFSDYFGKLGGRSFDFNSRYYKRVLKCYNNWGKKTCDESRYQAVNLTNDNTVELRFCKSTCDYDTFIQRVKMIFAIVEFCKKYEKAKIFTITKDTFIEEFNNFIKDNY